MRCGTSRFSSGRARRVVADGVGQDLPVGPVDAHARARRAPNEQHSGRTIAGHGVALARSAAPIRRPDAGHDLGRDRRPVHRHRSRRLGADVRSRGPPLCAPRARRPARGRRASSTRWSSTASACGRRRASPTVRRARSAPARASIRRAWRSGRAGWAHPQREPYTLSPDAGSRGVRGGRALGILAPSAVGHRAVAGLSAADRRPGLRRRGQPTDAGVHSRPPRRIAAAGRGDRRLRGVHAALPGVVERSRHPLAALDRAQRDGLRRPRRDRRLEHLVGVDRGRAQRTVVGSPDHRGVHVVLDLSAPGEPGAAGAPRGAAVRSRRRRGGHRCGASRVCPRGRPRLGGLSLGVLSRLRTVAGAGRRFARRARARRWRPGHGRRRRVGVDPRAQRRRLRPSGDRELAAGVPVARRAPSRGVERGGLRRILGPRRGAASENGCGGPSTSSTGRPSRSRSNG